VTDTDVWGVGYGFQDGSNVIQTQHWDGAAWNTVAPQMPLDPYSFFYGVIAPGSRNVWAAGTSLDSDGVNFSNLIEHWDGTSWQIVPTPNVDLRNNSLYAISAVSPNDIWAVGATDTTGGGLGRKLPLSLHWDGTAWTIVPTPGTAGGAKLSEKWPYPIAYDEIQAAPSNYKLLFEDQKLRYVGRSNRTQDGRNEAEHLSQRKYQQRSKTVSAALVLHVHPM
jgi:hypothetical protein